MANIFIGTGGTGGHIFPAQALAKSLAENHQVTVFGNKNYAKYIKSEQSFRSKVISSSQLNKNPIKLALALLKILFGVLQVTFDILIHDPKVVVTFGGYATFPTLIAAIITRRKIVLHEQNAHLGKVNRMAIRFASVLAVSFPATSGIDQKYTSKVVFTGNLVREEILKLNNLEYTGNALEDLPFFNILVIGGSGGARVFSDILPEVFFNLDKHIKSRLQITQQCRSDLLEETKDKYQKYQLNTTLSSFFDNMEELLKSSHLVIARSGSSSIAEFCVAKKPMILVPFANSADNHQEKNAEFLKRNNAAIVLLENDFTLNNTSQILGELISNQKKLTTLSNNASKCAQLDANKILTKIIVNLCRKKNI